MKARAAFFAECAASMRLASCAASGVFASWCFTSSAMTGEPLLKVSVALSCCSRDHSRCMFSRPRRYSSSWLYCFWVTSPVSFIICPALLSRSCSKELISFFWSSLDLPFICPMVATVFVSMSCNVAQTLLSFLPSSSLNAPLANLLPSSSSPAVMVVNCERRFCTALRPTVSFSSCSASESGFFGAVALCAEALCDEALCTEELCTEAFCGAGALTAAGAARKRALAQEASAAATARERRVILVGGRGGLRLGR
mmetsp:Transcript_47179/g.132678  ORF Transcript_47179/g.132678 Transcript_47179/m.132678 type:complete len:255 (+) Transcript_47179:118-882(+)